MTVRAYDSTLGRIRMLAGDPALDFANTRHWRDGREVDFLPDFRSIVDWSVAAGLLRDTEGEQLRLVAEEDPSRSSILHQQILELRDGWRQHLSSTIGPQASRAGTTLPEPFADMLSEILSSGQMAMGLLTVADRAGANILLLPAVRIALAITSLYLMPIDRRLGRCEGDPCGGFFLNNSRSKPRRWCSMESCGNRAKVRQFRSRFVAEEAG